MILRCSYLQGLPRSNLKVESITCLRYAHPTHSISGRLSHHAPLGANRQGKGEGNGSAVCFYARTVLHITVFDRLIVRRLPSLYVVISVMLESKFSALKACWVWCLFGGPFLSHEGRPSIPPISDDRAVVQAAIGICKQCRMMCRSIPTALRSSPFDSSRDLIRYS